MTWSGYITICHRFRDNNNITCNCSTCITYRFAVIFCHFIITRAPLLTFNAPPIIITQMDLKKTLLGSDKMSSSWTIEEKQKMDNKAMNQIHLHLLNDVFQDSLREKSIISLCLKLEQLCIMKNLPNKLHLKLFWHKVHM